MFLRKHKEKVSDKITTQKANLKAALLKDNKFIEAIEKWEKEKKVAIKKLEETIKQKNPKASKKEIGEMMTGMPRPV